MGVINMAHGEFLTIGAYTIYLVSTLTETYVPSLMPYYFIVAVGLAFIVAFAFGLLTEWLLIRHLYRRPLDTLLATWGLSLGMQQAFRSIFGAKEVSATLPDWVMGSVKPTEGIDIPINGLFVMALTVVLTAALLFALFKSRWGLQVRATMQNRVMSGAVGINTRKVDRITFALGCGIAGIAGAAFTTIGSTGPTAGSLYIVDTFLTVVFGGAASLFGTIASAFTIAQTQATSEFFMTGSMAKVLTLSMVVIILMLRPQGLFAAKVRK
jgi:urea transport system permease protein